MWLFYSEFKADNEIASNWGKLLLNRCILYFLTGTFVREPTENDDSGGIPGSNIEEKS